MRVKAKAELVTLQARRHPDRSRWFDLPKAGFNLCPALSLDIISKSDPTVSSDSYSIRKKR